MSVFSLHRNGLLQPLDDSRCCSHSLPATRHNETNLAQAKCRHRFPLLRGPRGGDAPRGLHLGEQRTRSRRRARPAAGRRSRCIHGQALNQRHKTETSSPAEIAYPSRHEYFWLDGHTALLEAAGRGHAKIVNQLIRAGAKADACLEDGTSSLWTAAKLGHIGIVHQLLNAGARVNQATAEGESPLFMACECGHPQVVSVLIAAKAAVSQKSNDGATPLFMAMQNSRYNNAIYLLPTPNKPAPKGQDKCVELLLRAGAPNQGRRGDVQAVGANPLKSSTTSREKLCGSLCAPLPSLCSFFRVLQLSSVLFF